ncbi:MAG: CxxC-x17-CxxC domain-containing protein [Candidatus Margulisiibacteriota bacterium]
MFKKFSSDKFSDRGPKKRGFEGGGRSNLFKAVCSDCGSSCEVPFKPMGGRPVLCDACFKKDGPAYPKPDRYDRSDRGAERGFDRGSERGFDRGPAAGGDVSRQLSAINAKLDRILSILDEIDEDY